MQSLLLNFKNVQLREVSIVRCRLFEVQLVSLLLIWLVSQVSKRKQHCNTIFHLLCDFLQKHFSTQKVILKNLVFVNVKIIEGSKMHFMHQIPNPMIPFSIDLIYIGGSKQSSFSNANMYMRYTSLSSKLQNIKQIDIKH